MKAVTEWKRGAVLGAGTMGAGIAQVLAEAGFETRLYDIEDGFVERGLAGIRKMLDKGVARGKKTQELADAVFGRIQGGTDLEAAVADCELVVEAVPERLELKQEVFQRVAAAAPQDAMLGTNTSSIPISKIAEGVPQPGRFLGLHFFNPPPLMPLLEIVYGEKTAPEAVSAARELAGRLGKDGVVVRDSPGFATSRLGVALALEAIRMLEEGVASAKDIDTAMSLGYRHPMGPLELTDLIGLDVRLHISETLAEHLGADRFQAPELLQRLVAEGKHGKKSGEGFYLWVDGKPQVKDAQ